MGKKVFLSYSWKDREIAKRLYDDLSRSHVSIWRDQIDGNPIADFEKEFLQEIDKCDYFIMLDSINYREKSKWCCKEVERCIENQKKRSSPQIVVCLLVPDGKWRTCYKDNNSRYIFEQVNRLKYHNLFYNRYDDLNVYDNTVNFLCSLLGTSYERWDKLPSYQDLMDELNNEYVKEAFDDITSNIILGGYKNILYKIERSYPTVKDSFKIWITDCEKSNTALFFPKWTFSIWLINQKQIDIDEILSLLFEITKKYPNDPRGFRALGCFYADLTYKGMLSQTYYEYSKDALLKAKELLDRPENQRQKCLCYFEVLTNIGKIYSILKNEKSAISYWKEALSIMKMEHFFYEPLVSDLFITLKSQNCSINSLYYWLEKMHYLYPLEPILYQLMGLLKCEVGESYSAYSLMEKAYSINPSAENLCYLTNIKITLGIIDYDEIIQLCNTKHWNDEDLYWIEEIKESIRRVRGC